MCIIIDLKLFRTTSFGPCLILDAQYIRPIKSNTCQILVQSYRTIYVLIAINLIVYLSQMSNNEKAIIYNSYTIFQQSLWSMYFLIFYASTFSLIVLALFSSWSTAPDSNTETSTPLLLFILNFQSPFLKIIQKQSGLAHENTTQSSVDYLMISNCRPIRIKGLTNFTHSFRLV